MQLRLCRPDRDVQDPLPDKYQSNPYNVRRQGNPEFVLEAFKGGADGVLVAGCRLDECHYLYGNIDAKQRMEVLKEVVKEIGLDPRIIRTLWISAAEGERFSKTITDFVKELEEIGPIGTELKLDEARVDESRVDKTGADLEEVAQ